jgi:hypothetical protein
MGFIARKETHFKYDPEYIRRVGYWQKIISGNKMASEIAKETVYRVEA